MPKKQLRLSFIILLIFIIISSVLIFALFKDSFTPHKKVFSTKFYTSKGLEKELSVNQIGFFFEPKKFQLQFSTQEANCVNYVEIPQNVGEELVANYKEKPDFNQMFEFRQNEIILLRSLYSKNLSLEEYEFPYIVIPEAFYERGCR